MRDSIYCLAFTVNLKDEEMENKWFRPTPLQRKEVTLTALLCGFCQLLVASLLLNEFYMEE